MYQNAIYMVNTSILGGAVIGGRRLKKKSVYKIFTGK